MHDLSWRERLWKTCLIMKFLVFLLFVSTLQLSADVYSQEARVSLQNEYLQPIITQYFIDNKSEIWLLFLIAHSKR